MQNQYWIRYCFRELGALDSEYMSKAKCYAQIKKDMKANDFISFCYVMTNDAFGECFLDLIRPEAIERGCL
jgi:hypothetical protein